MSVPEGEEEPPARRPRLGGWGGCLLWALAFVFVIVAGCSVGLVLRPDPYEPAEVARGQGWKVEVHNDHGDKCVNLVIGNTIRTAQCDFLVEGEFRATSYEVGGGQYVIFARVPDDADQVRLRLADGSRPVIDVEEDKDIRYFVYEADGPDKGPSELLDDKGQVIPPT